MPWLAGALDPETTLAAAAVPVTDTLYADVSEWQRPVDDSYPYRVLAIRSNDGTHRDRNWTSNYGWCERRCDENALVFFIVYFVWRKNWQQTVKTLKDLVGQPHPRMAVMIDVESWEGQITGNQSDGLNKAFQAVADWLGDQRRVIAYGNRGDLNGLWPDKPVGLRIVLAAYGSNPGYPGKIAHQYTNGEGYGGGPPEGCPPFGKCCMDSADGLTPVQYAAACGIGAAVEGDPKGDDDRVMLAAVHEPRSRAAPKKSAAWEPKSTKTARSQAKPAKKARSQRASKAGQASNRRASKKYPPNLGVHRVGRRQLRGWVAAAQRPHIEAAGDLAGLIIEASGFPGWDSFGALIHHSRFVRDHHKHVKKVAVVTDSALGDFAERLASHFVSAEIRHFPAGQVEEARQWIINGA